MRFENFKKSTMSKTMTQTLGKIFVVVDAMSTLFLVPDEVVKKRINSLARLLACERRFMVWASGFSTVKYIMNTVAAEPKPTKSSSLLNIWTMAITPSIMQNESIEKSWAILMWRTFSKRMNMTKATEKVENTYVKSDGGP